MAYIRTVKTASKATAVQIVHSNRRGSRDIEHIGSAHTPEDVEVLKAVARQRLHANQDTLDFGDGRPGGAGAADLVDPVPASVGRVGPGLSRAGVRRRVRRRRGVPGVGAGPADRADQQAGHDPGAGRDRDRRRPAIATINRRLPGLRDRGVAAAAGGEPARRMSGWARPPWCSTT